MYGRNDWLEIFKGKMYVLGFGRERQDFVSKQNMNQFSRG